MGERHVTFEDTVERCENRLSLLRNKKLEANKAIHSLKKHAESVEKALSNDAEKLKNKLWEAIDEKLSELMETVRESTMKDIEEATALEAQIASDIDRVEEFKMQADKDIEADENLEISRKLQDIGKGPLDVDYASLSISSKIDDASLLSAVAKCKAALDITMTGLVQITECTERPGAIQVVWDEEELSDCASVATDNSTYTETFILQCCVGSADEADAVFNTIYEGEDMQFLMTFAEPNQVYTFRVCQYHSGGTGVGVCGPWSLPKKAFTTMPPHSWRSGDCHTASGLVLYQLSNNNRTATKVFPESSKILRSQNASYLMGQHLTFRIDETSDNMPNDGIGLMSKDGQDKKQLTQWSSAAIINSAGTVFVNGTAMVTKLPPLQRNSIVVFHAREQCPNKLRVSISVDDKEVTFDWATTSETHDMLYFACGFEQTGWQVSVS